MAGVKHRLRFSIEDDLWLLREVLGQNPYTDSAKWTTIRENIHLATGKNFSVRSVKEHVNLLLQIWLRKENPSKKSGVEEAAYIEKDSLLQKIFNMSKEHQTVHKTLTIKEKRSTEEERETTGSWENENTNSFTHVLCNNYTDLSFTSTSETTIPHVASELSSNMPFTTQKENLKTEIPYPRITINVPGAETATSTPTTLPPSQSQIIGPIRATQKTAVFKKSVLNYLKQKNEREFTIRSRELDLQEKKVELEERKLKLDEEKLIIEVYERRKRLELEEEKLKAELNERQQMRQIMESQRKIIETLMQTIEKKE